MNSIKIRLAPFFKTLTLLLFFTVSATIVFAQDDLKTETIDGKKYYLHKIEQGHTLYAVSKKYLIGINEIIKENPGVEQGLQIGQVLKIPVIKENKKLNKKNSPQLEGNFILHEVEQGQTLYSLSKLYNIDLAEIVNENPNVQNDMHIGRILKIPVNKVKNVKKSSISPAKADNWLRHIVIKGETKYSLSKKYNCSIDSLIALNDGFPQGLKEGDTIKIPQKISLKDDGISGKENVKGDIYNYIKEKLQGVPDDSIRKFLFREYQIALLLPFFLEENDSFLDHQKGLYSQSLISVEFYEGFLIALDSLRKQGFNARVHVYDSGSDSLQTKAVLSKPELKKMDLIVGPLYLAGFVEASKFALENQIHIISPFIHQNAIITGNPYASKALPAYTTQFEQIAEFIADTFSNQNVIIIHNNAIADKPLLDAFMKGAKYKNLSVKEIKYKTSGIAGVKGALSLSKKNIIIVPSNNQVFVTELITKLNFAVNADQVLVFGSDKWLDFENLDINYLHKLKTHIATSAFVDYNANEIKRIIETFRDKYHTDPTMYAFQGFDIGYFYLSLLKTYGKSFAQKNNSFNHKGAQVVFNMNKIAPDSGFENKGISIIRYEDFKLVKVN